MFMFNKSRYLLEQVEAVLIPVLIVGFALGSLVLSVASITGH